MTTVTATITSKNQLTLPAKLVRKYGMDKNRRVTITDNKGKLIITPEPTLSEALQEVRAQIRSHLPKDFDYNQVAANGYRDEIHAAFNARYDQLEHEGRT